MTKYPNITITFTINPDDVALRVQATCDDMKKQEILFALDKMKEKINSGEFQTHESGAYYSEETFPLHETVVDTDSISIISKEDEEEVFKEWEKAEEEAKKKWEQAKEEVRSLIEPKYFEFAEDHDTFYSEGIVEIVETDEKVSGYSGYRHCRIKGDGKLYMLINSTIETTKEDSEFEGEPIFYWVWQTTGYMGDDYSGFLLLPLSDGRYWKIGYSC